MYNMLVNDFDSQSELIIGFLMKNQNMSKDDAEKEWFQSKTYSEIIRRKLFYVSASRAYSELLMEQQNNDEWMRNPFDM